MYPAKINDILMLQAPAPPPPSQGWIVWDSQRSSGFVGRLIGAITQNYNLSTVSQPHTPSEVLNDFGGAVAPHIFLYILFLFRFEWEACIKSMYFKNTSIHT